MKKFEELGLSKELLKVLNELKFTEATEIQEKTIPLALAGKDIVGGSFTGSGKTLAFAVPILEKLVPNKNIQALILTPTRELAEQITNAMRGFSRYKDFKFVSIYGGVDIEAQIRKLSRADIVVGTPGRILDHLERRTMNLGSVKFLVLDEVDRMLDMGFHRDVEKIIKKCPEKRQTILFSATISPDIDHLVKRYTKDAVEVAVESYVDHSKLKQIYYDVPSNMKFSLLVHLLKQEKADLVMVFSNTRRNADLIAGNLHKLGINAQPIHGGLTQSKRIKVLDDFHGKGVGVLVCTDVAARGLDIKGVTHVYNYDIPDVANDYVHRIGRTARAKTEGIAINLVASRDYENFGNVIRSKEFNIVKMEMPEIIRVEMDLGAGKKKEFRESIGRGQSGRSSGGRSFSRGSSDRRPVRNYDRSSSRSSEDRPRRDYGDRGSSGGSFGAKRSYGNRSSDRGESASKKPYSKGRAMNEEFVSNDESGREFKRKPFGAKRFSRDSDEKTKRSFSGSRSRDSRSQDKPRRSYGDRTSPGGENRTRSGRFGASRTPRREVARNTERSERPASGPRTNRDSKFKRTPSRDSRGPVKRRF